jgi:hypothetical protein
MCRFLGCRDGVSIVGAASEKRQGTKQQTPSVYSLTLNEIAFAIFAAAIAMTALTL